VIAAGKEKGIMKKFTLTLIAVIALLFATSIAFPVQTSKTVDTIANLVVSTGLTLSGGTANTVPYLNGSKAVTSSAVTPTELGYVSGVTSALQTQLDAKAPSTSPSFATGATLSYGTATTPVFLDASKALITGAFTVAAGADTACSTTCGATKVCLFGFDDGAADAETIVDCSGATADKCVCLGAP